MNNLAECKKDSNSAKACIADLLEQFFPNLKCNICPVNIKDSINIVRSMLITFPNCFALRFKEGKMISSFCYSQDEYTEHYFIEPLPVSDEKDLTGVFKFFCCDHKPLVLKEGSIVSRDSVETIANIVYNVQFTRVPIITQLELYHIAELNANNEEITPEMLNAVLPSPSDQESPRSQSSVRSSTESPVSSSDESHSQFLVSESPVASPVESPRSQSSVASPVESPSESPVASPVESPRSQSSVASPVESPRSQSSVASPVESPRSQSSVASPVESPSESPVASPVESPSESPVASPVESPSESPVESPSESPRSQSQVSSPKSDDSIALEQIPTTPKSESPVESPKSESPVESPKSESPVESPVKNEEIIDKLIELKQDLTAKLEKAKQIISSNLSTVGKYNKKTTKSGQNNDLYTKECEEITKGLYQTAHNIKLLKQDSEITEDELKGLMQFYSRVKRNATACFERIKNNEPSFNAYLD